jgi:hypothetical protein
VSLIKGKIGISKIPASIPLSLKAFNALNLSLDEETFGSITLLNSSDPQVIVNPTIALPHLSTLFNKSMSLKTKSLLVIIKTPNLNLSINIRDFLVNSYFIS